ncbi:UNVERIFIED_CONTAM: putative serine/threonine-protein kinase PIX13 [Sesamum angustifolium]|uniref:non-specific serine/threonine protein kinase n=1 Tax=Sesamum angustifolium TaxID=2727405 RepID=A0AAW2QDI6_9LAMI
MGICSSSCASPPPPPPTPSSSSPSTAQFSSVAASQTTSNTTSSTSTSTSTSSGSSSTISGNSRFSALSGGSTNEGSPTPAGHMLPHPNLRIFSFSELKAATRNFRSDTVLGEGGFGKVYKGWLDDKSSARAAGNGSSVIAVKKLNSESMQGFQEWQFCAGLHNFLAYLFSGGSAAQPLPWDIRLKILIGAARGLAFLHASDRKVIYRDFKASNILLDGSYHAKISDFGLAKMGPTASRSHVTTQVMGTYGYAAPEYVATVEMLTGLRALDTNRPSGQHNLVDWIKPRLSDRRKLKNIMDLRLEGRYPSKSVLQIAQLALNCLENEPKNRPSMQEIVETLERIDSANERPRERRVHSSYQTVNHRHGQQPLPLQYRSPLHPRQEGNRAYPLPPRS